MLWNLCKTFTHTQEHGKDTHVFFSKCTGLLWIANFLCSLNNDTLCFLFRLFFFFKITVTYETIASLCCFTSLWSILSSLPIIPNIQTLLTHDQCLPTALMCDRERHMLSTQDKNGITPALRRKKAQGIHFTT